MPVQLDQDGHPVAWSDDDRLEGEDIPLPPDRLTRDPHKRALWTGSEWVEDTDWRPDPDTATGIRFDLEAGNITVREALLRLLP